MPDWEARVRENHAYRQPRAISAEQRHEAEPRAEALAVELRRLVRNGTTEEGLRGAVGRVLGLEPDQVEVKGTGFAPLRGVAVGGGGGLVCVNGSVDREGRVDAEVAGRTNDGPCLPGDGGH
ncbi:hypothetical protein [Streptomyces sp. CA-253872]|uniref:hypothetical protein n=1 Tax=Streptomyces sp. CA-253872 TaxID=3240067 RepID=UPI003D94CA4C